MSEPINLDDIAGELEEHAFILDGKTYTAPADLSLPQLRAMAGLSASDVDFANDPVASIDACGDLLRVLFGDEQGGELFASCGLKTLAKLMEAISTIYNLEDLVGKAPGSNRASRRTGVPSKRTSSASTASISAKRASVKNGSAAAISHA